LQTRLWEAIKIDGVGSDEVARHLLARLLVPGEVSYAAVSKTLAEMGKVVEVDHLRTRSTNQMIDFLLVVCTTFYRSHDILATPPSIS
jgi:hypothetical protein